MEPSRYKIVRQLSLAHNFHDANVERWGKPMITWYETLYIDDFYKVSAYDLSQVDNLGFGVDKREVLEEQLSNGDITFRCGNASL